MTCTMIRISFRQAMFAGFALIVLLLGSVALRSWLIVEGLVEQNRRNSEQAVQLTSAVQAFEQGGVDLERSARQYLVLDSPQVARHFDEQVGRALARLALLDGGGSALGDWPGRWRQAVWDLAEAVAPGGPETMLAPYFERLVQLNAQLREAVQRLIDDRRRQAFRELEANRVSLSQQMALSLLGAMGVATAMGWWLARPVRRLERAIVRLGENRFDGTVDVGGPDDLRRLGLRVDWLRRRLGELEAERERSLRHVSHELKTPLTALKEGVALLAEEVPGPLAPGQSEVVRILEHNVASLQRQIESLLSLNAVAFEARRLCLSTVRVRDLLAGALRRRELQIQSRGLHAILEAPEAVARLDDEKMRVILDNLISNAVDFSPDGGDIVLRAVRRPGQWLFECIDQGPGIADEDRSRIFEPFVQGRRPAPVPREGSGVGLSIVRELTRAMGGRVCLVPSPLGAHFCVELPDEI